MISITPDKAEGQHQVGTGVGAAVMGGAVGLGMRKEGDLSYGQEPLTQLKCDSVLLSVCQSVPDYQYLPLLRQ